jgi:dissimilatory sulfite reductase (desulfoviridin) alpha/beta subunit
MAKLTLDEINGVKSKGFLRNRGTDLFSGRVVPVGTVFTAEQLHALAELSEKFGNGKLMATSRQSIEVPGIAYENIPAAIEFAQAHDLHFGGTGAKVRPITACKGTTCVFGMYDTQALAKKIHETYYVGWSNVTLPHKFKISVGGCPNSCIKPSINDFGVEGNRENGTVVYKIYVGGTWGKTCRMGTALSRKVSEEEILPILEKCMLWFRENGYAKERFGLAIDRVGFEAFEAAILSDDLLARKDEILTAEIKQKP